MSNTPNDDENADEDMLPEYDLSGRLGVRGKYYRALREGYTLKVERTDGTMLVQHIVRPEGTVTLDSDVRAFFPDAESVNATLRALIQLVPTREANTTSS